MPDLCLLIESNPDALRVQNHQGLLPVQMALHRARSEALQGQFELCFSLSDSCCEHEVESVQFYVEQRPESIRQLDAQGRTLAHHALDGPATPEHRVAWSLLQKWLVRDRQGFQPLHVAAITDAPFGPAGLDPAAAAEACTGAGGTSSGAAAAAPDRGIGIVWVLNPRSGREWATPRIGCTTAALRRWMRGVLVAQRAGPIVDEIVPKETRLQRLGVYVDCTGSNRYSWKSYGFAILQQPSSRR
jgi:hypothetical protein